MAGWVAGSNGNNANSASVEVEVEIEVEAELGNKLGQHWSQTLISNNILFLAR